MTNLEQKLAERAKLLADMRAMDNKAQNEKRSFTSEEKEQFERMNADAASINETVERSHQMEQLEKQITQTRGRVVDPLNSFSNEERQTVTDSKDYKRALDTYFRTGEGLQKLKGMTRAIASTTDSGALLPTDVNQMVIDALNRGSVMKRAGATVIQSSSNLNIPISTAVTGTFESEATTFASAEPTYTSFTAHAYKVTSKALLSTELIDDAGFDITAHITERLLDGMAQTADNKYVIGAGSGSSLPTGIIGSSGATATVTSVIAWTQSDLINHYYSCPAQYRSDPSFAWIGSDVWIGQVASYGMVVGGGSDVTIRVPFVPRATPGGQDMLFGAPIFSSAAVSTATSANSLVAVCGAMKYYTIVDRIQNNFTIARLNELYAETGQVMFLGGYRTDGMLTVADAARTMKLASS